MKAMKRLAAVASAAALAAMSVAAFGMQASAVDSVETGDSWLLFVNIVPTGAESMSTDTFPSLSVTIDEVLVDGATPEGYTTSANAVDTAYHEGGSAAGTTRLYLHDDWSGSGVTDLQSGTVSTISVTFTISGMESSGGEEQGQAFLCGQFDDQSNWSAGENSGTDVASIIGDGTYTVNWDVSQSDVPATTTVAEESSADETTTTVAAEESADETTTTAAEEVSATDDGTTPTESSSTGNTGDGTVAAVAVGAVAAASLGALALTATRRKK